MDEKKEERRKILSFSEEKEKLDQEWEEWKRSQIEKANEEWIREYHPNVLERYLKKKEEKKKKEEEKK